MLSILISIIFLLLFINWVKCLLMKFLSGWVWYVCLIDVNTLLLFFIMYVDCLLYEKDKIFC